MPYKYFSRYNYLLDEEEDENLKPSQVAQQEQKAKKEWKYFPTLGKKAEVYVEPTKPPPTVTPPEEPPTFREKAGKFISTVAEKVKEVFKPKEIISPIPPVLPTEIKQKEEGLKNYLTFPSLYPNPDITPSATLNRSQDINLAKLYFDTTNTIKKSATDFLTYHPAVNDVLNNYMRFSEKVNNVYNEYFPPQVAAKGLVRGFAKQVIGFTMPNPKETLEQVLPKPVNVFGRTVDTVSEFVGMVLPYIYGGKILESGLRQIVLNPRVAKLIASSSIWGIIGQTSSSSQTELQKRVAKLPNDTVTGALLSIVPVVRYGEGIEKFATSFVKGGTFNVALFSTNAYIDALIEGAKPNEAFEMAKQTAIMQGLIYTSLTGVNAFNYSLQPKTKTGNKVFTPSELRDIVSDPKAQNTPEGKQILKIASEAEKANKNVEINADAIRNSWLGEKLAPLTIEGKPVKGVFTFNYKLVDRLPEITVEKKAVVPVEVGLAKTAVKTPPSLIELAKQFTSAKDFASELGTKPTSQVGEIDANRITPRDPVDQASVDKIKADIEAGKKIEPIIATEENGVITTTDGSNRTVAYQQLGQIAPVIITKGNVEELKTIEEVYNEVKPAAIKPEEKPPVIEKLEKEVFPPTGIKKVGEEIIDRDGKSWLITEDLGEGKFKATPNEGIIADPRVETKIENGKLFMKDIDGNWVKPFAYTFQAPTKAEVPKVEEFKIGDIFDPQGKTNMVGKVTITGIEGNALKFTDSKGTEFSGMQRSLVRDLIKGGSWKRVSEPTKAQAEISEKIKEFESYGAEITGNKVVLYHGTDDPNFTPSKLNYGTFLSSVKEGTDIVGNQGASSYGKNVYRLELPLEDVRVNTTGEFQYIGKFEVKKGAKYPKEFYKQYNDYYGANLTPQEIDKEGDVWDVAKALVGYEEAKAKQIIGVPQTATKDQILDFVKFNKPIEEKLTKPTKEKPIEKAPQLVEKPPIKTSESIKIYNTLNKKAARRSLPILENMRVKDGKMYFTDLNTEVVVNTDLENGTYKMVGKDFVKTEVKEEDLVSIMPDLRVKIAEILGANLAEMYKDFSLFANTDETRPTLTGLYFEAKGNKLAVSATDGFRVLYKTYPIKGIKDSSVIIADAKKLSSLIKVLGEGKVEIKIKEGTKEKIDFASFTSDTARITTNTVYGEYPKIHKIFPRYDKRVSVNKTELAQAVKDIAPYSKEISNLMLLTLEEGRITVSARGRPVKEGGVGEKKITLKAEVKDITTPSQGIMEGSLIMPVKQESIPENSIAVNYRYLEDSVKVGKNDDIYIDFQIAEAAKEGVREGQINPLVALHISDKAEKFTLYEEPKPAIEPKIQELRTAIRKALDEKINVSVEQFAQKYDLEPTVVSEEMRKIIEERKVAPIGYASVDKFADIENLTKNLDRFRIIPFPEMVRLAKELMGGVPKIKLPRYWPTLGGRPLGLFVPKGEGQIILNPEIFKEPDQAAKALAHEIGHLADYLPDKTMARGNLVGRIATLYKHLHRIYGELDNKVIRGELKELSQLWKPFDENKVPASFIKYRYDASELYADAISVLLNDPALLEENAPTFFQGFTDYLDRKPQVREEYMKLQQLLERGSDEVNKVRLEEIYKGFEEGRKARQKAFDDEMDGKSNVFQRVSGWYGKAKARHISKFMPIYSKLDKLVKEGKIEMTEKQKVRETLEEMAYSRNDIWLDLQRNEEEVADVIKKAGITEDQLGAWFVLERNLADRLTLANPDGLIGEFNKEVADYLTKDFTPTQQEVLRKAVANFHKATFEIVDKMHKEGMIKDEVFREKIEPFRDSYVTYGVVKYIDKNFVSPYVKKMKGTLEKIENPYVTTMFKRASMLQTLSTHKGKREIVYYLKEFFPDEIEKSKSRLGKMNERIYERTFGKGQIGLFEEGTWTAYDVDPYFEDMFSHFNPKDIHTLVEIAAKFNRVFKPTVTTYKIGWALYSNPFRDIQRTMMNLAAISKIEGIKWSRSKFLADWVKTIPEGFKFGKGELTPFGKLALGAKAISTPWISYDPTAGEDKALYALYRKYSFLTGADPIKRNRRIKEKFLLPIQMIFKTLEISGATFESTSKLAGYKYLSKRLKDQGKVGFYVRNYVGTPNYLEGGSMKETDNSLFVFSNVIIQGLRSDVELVRTPKTKGAYFFEMFLQTGIWKVLMLAMAGGLLGKKLEDKFNRMSEYDKTNYITFPFCLNRLEKVFHWRIPQAEVNRLAGAIIWKTGMAIQGKLTKPEQVFDVGVGLLPTTITPIFEIVGAWFDYIRGINPYDSFYGRNVLDYQTEKIRGVEGLKQMSYWTLNKLGLGNFATYDLSEKTTTEKIIQFTPILSRAIRISDYGMTEIEREVEKVELKERAIEAKKEDDVIKKYVSEYLEKGGDREDYKQKTIDELFPEGVATKEEKSDAKRIEKDFDQMILKRKGDIRVRTIMKLQLNTSKIKTLNKYKEEMSEEEYDNLLDILLDNKVISKDVYKEVK